MKLVSLQKGHLEGAEVDVQQEASPAACWAAEEQRRSCLRAVAVAEIADSSQLQARPADSAAAWLLQRWPGLPSQKRHWSPQGCRACRQADHWAGCCPQAGRRSPAVMRGLQAGLLWDLHRTDASSSCTHRATSNIAYARPPTCASDNGKLKFLQTLLNP